MKSVDFIPDRRRRTPAFTLVEMLVVIAIMSILMTAGAIGLGGLGGKGVTTGVATAESLFDEARAMAVGKNIRTCVLVAKNLTNNGTENLRRMVVAYENVDSTTGIAKETDPNKDPDWVLSSRGAILPDQTYFSQTFSVIDHEKDSGDIPYVSGANIKSAPSASSGAAKSATSSYAGDYYIYEFNAEGIFKHPGATFVIGSGTRGLTPIAQKAPPKITNAAKRDFGGFVVWRNGRTSVFRSPEQISDKIKKLRPGEEF